MVLRETYLSMSPFHGFCSTLEVVAQEKQTSSADYSEYEIRGMKSRDITEPVLQKMHSHDGLNVNMAGECQNT